MIKAVITGFVTGLIISAILIGATYVLGLPPDTFTANLFFLASFFICIAAVLWLGLNYYCRTSAVKWMTLSVTGAISSVIAAVLVSIFQSPFNVALYQFRDLMTILFIISIAIAALYYLLNRKKVSSSKDHELIF